MKKKYIIASIIISTILGGCSQANLQIDSDNDGVMDYEDVCSNTPKMAIVDRYGCAKDSDNDGVIDLYDKCKNTPLLDIVNSSGCSVR